MQMYNISINIYITFAKTHIYTYILAELWNRYSLENEFGISCATAHVTLQSRRFN